jgi:hypothetical protein
LHNSFLDFSGEQFGTQGRERLRPVISSASPAPLKLLQKLLIARGAAMFFRSAAHDATGAKL